MSAERRAVLERELEPVISMKRVLSAAVVTAWGLFLILLVLQGDARRYVSPGYIWLVLVAGTLMVVIGVVFWTGRKVPHLDANSPWHEMECRCRSRYLPGAGELAALVLLTIPLVAVAVVPAGQLGAFAAQQKGLTVADSSDGAPPAQPDEFKADPLPPPPPPELRDATRTLSMREIVYAAAFERSEEDEQVHSGDTVSVIGFVSRPDPRQPTKVVATRFLVTCCVADAMPIGVELRGAGMAGLKDDTWVKVTGQIGWPARDSYDITKGFPTPWMTVEGIEEVPAPEDIYVY